MTSPCATSPRLDRDTILHCAEIVQTLVRLGEPGEAEEALRRLAASLTISPVSETREPTNAWDAGRASLSATRPNLHGSLLGEWYPARCLNMGDAVQIDELCKLLNGMQRQYVHGEVKRG